MDREDEAPPIVQSNGVLPLAISSQGVKPQVAECGNRLEGLTCPQDLDASGEGFGDDVTPLPLGRRLLFVTPPQLGGTECDLDVSPVAAGFMDSPTG